MLVSSRDAELVALWVGKDGPVESADLMIGNP